MQRILGLLYKLPKAYLKLTGHGTIEKEITSDLNELQIDGVTSKGSRFRKSVFEYVTTEKGNASNKLIVEINSFANPFPFLRPKCVYTPE